MLQTVIIAMTVVGCNHQASHCESLPQPVTHWENRIQCEAEIPGVVRKPDYPIIIARCDEKVVVAIADALEISPATGRPVAQHRVGEPLNINPLKPVQTAKSDNSQSVAGTVMASTKHGFIFVREGAWGGYKKLRDGTAVGYSRMRGSVGAMVAATVGFAARTAGAASNFIRD